MMVETSIETSEVVRDERTRRRSSENPPEGWPPRMARLSEIALAALAALVPAGTDTTNMPELCQLGERLRQRQLEPALWREALAQALRQPAPEDNRLVHLGAELSLAPTEILAVALIAAVEEDPFAGRVIARLQTPLGGSRPTLGLLARAFCSRGESIESVLWTLFNGAAAACGLIEFHNEAAPIAERTAGVPVQLCLAFRGQATGWQGVNPGSEVESLLGESARLDAARHARALAASRHPVLLIRSPAPSEGRSAAVLLASAMHREAVFIATEKLAGLGPWLRIFQKIPVFTCNPAPGEVSRIPDIVGYAGPRIAIAGVDGTVETTSGAPATWVLPVPPQSERECLWKTALGEGAEAAVLARDLARYHRHGAGRISMLGRLARHQAALDGRTQTQIEDVLASAWTGEGAGLDGLAEPIRIAVPDDALVTSAGLKLELELLLHRCRHRDGLADHLGVSAAVRYRPGVRALFTGPSGSGKTLAAGWLATRLRLPLYRVDLANITSKYIGETEKNLAQLLAQAERAEVILLFDEADALFGKRTEIRDSNDRFANSQTNYLLQRIENYDGIVVLTSNSRARFDSAFARRLDWVVEFNLPAAEERRAIWLAHLGESHAISPAELNQLAALADIAGGHIRNAVLTAALLAQGEDRAILLTDCVRGLEAEYRKLGRPLPGGLACILTP